MRRVADAGQAGDREFHRLVLEASENRALVALVGSMGAVVQLTTRFKQRAHRSPRDPMPERLQLCEAIASRDLGEARKVMQNLLNLAFRDMAMAG